MKRFLISGLCAISLLTPVWAAETTKDMKADHVIESFGSVSIDWSEGTIKVTGVGSPPDRGEAVQKRLMAERMATADAFKQLEKIIAEIRVNSETLVRDYTSESENLKTYVNALIKGAQKMDQRYLDDGSIEVDLTVKLYSNAGLSGVIQPQKHVVPPIPVSLKADDKADEYTGIIVDCRGLGLEPAMSPAILSISGGELYLGELEIKPDFVINEGVVGYAHSLVQARQIKRVGLKPLVIKGLNATGTFSTDVVVSEVDTKQLLSLNEKFKLLQDAKVVFVL